MRQPIDIDFADVQALLRFGHGRLTETRFMLLDINDASAARRWLASAPVSDAASRTPPPETALQVAFSVAGLRALEIDESILAGFSDAFITGMSGDANRSRRMGDTGTNAPQNWRWGGDPQDSPHLILLLYATPGKLAGWQRCVEVDPFASAFRMRQMLPTDDLGFTEPFGFADGISQPQIDWQGQQATDTHSRSRFSNRSAPGEFLLGYPNEYGQCTSRPLVDPKKDRRATLLADAPDAAGMKDFAHNGSYLVLRHLHQDVPEFWRFVDSIAGGDPDQRERLAAGMVGRRRDGSPLVPPTTDAIAGISAFDAKNHFTYDADPHGYRCPVGAHVRRANPRTGDLPVDPDGRDDLVARLLRMLGWRARHPGDDLVAATRFHRLLRRGRAYGPPLSPEAAVKPDAPAAERGLQFIVLVANISRQFEFVQNAWSMSSRFAGLRGEQDPLLGVRQPLENGAPTDGFNQPDPAGPGCRIDGLPQFVTVRGGGYFFMPGLRTLAYLSADPNP